MKRISILAAALLGAALFFGCSNGSDAPIYTGPVLPANVGTNEFAGKTLTVNGKLLSYSYVAKMTFTALNTLSTTQTVTYPETAKASAYNHITEGQYTYSCDSKTKSLYTKQSAAAVSYIERNGNKTVYPDLGPFTTDAQYIEAYKTRARFIYDKVTDEELEKMAKATRMTEFYKYGYADPTNAAAVTDEMIAKYNKIKAADTTNYLISIQAYQINDSTAKLLSDERIPASVVSLDGIYGVYEIVGTLKSGTTRTYSLSYSSNFYKTPSIIKYDGTEGYKIASVTPVSIIVSEKATKETAPSPFYTYTAETNVISYKTAKNDNDITFDFGALGQATLKYARETNIPSMSSAITYTVSN